MYNAGAAANRPVDSERAMRTVHVGGIGGLGETITENDVADFFGQQGEVAAVRISGRFCWVEFADLRAAHAALGLDGETTGGHHLRVSQSKSAIHSNGLRRKDGGGGVEAGPAHPQGQSYPGGPANPYGAYGAPVAPYGGGYPQQQQYGGYYGQQAPPFPPQMHPHAPPYGYGYPQQQPHPQQGYHHPPPPPPQQPYPPHR